VVGEVLGGGHVGGRALEAHRARGLGVEGHQALASRSGIQRRNT